MALITCPECGKSISDKAETCIHCGTPLKNPLEKLLPKCDQLWEAKQNKECLQVCGEILLLNPNDYAIILRHDICRRFIADDVSIGINGYLKAVSVFNSTSDIREEDATRFANGIITLFSSVIGSYNYLNNLKSKMLELEGAVLHPFAPVSGPQADMLHNSLIIAKNDYHQQKQIIEPIVNSFAKEMYNNFPKKLFSLTEVGREAYEYIEKQSYFISPEMKKIISINNPALVEKIKQENKTSGGCYVATCVYGSYDCPEVWTLRRYRDATLARSWYGRAFIHTYYAVSPTLVKWFGHTAWFKNMWHGTLDRIVNRLNARGVENTPYHDREW